MAHRLNLFGKKKKKRFQVPHWVIVIGVLAILTIIVLVRMQYFTDYSKPPIGYCPWCY